MKKDLGTNPAWVSTRPSGTKIPRTCCIGVDSSNYLSSPPTTCTEGAADYNMKVCLICHRSIHHIGVYKINTCNKD